MARQANATQAPSALIEGWFEEPLPAVAAAPATWDTRRTVPVATSYRNTSSVPWLSTWLATRSVA